MSLVKPKNKKRVVDSKYIWRGLKKGKYVYLMFLPIIAFYLIFNYYPMYGLVIAFRKYIPGQSFLAGDFVGLKYFINFFKSPLSGKVITNTLMINLWSLAIGFPAPIIFALLLNEVRVNSFKRTVQTITYLPHFVSVVVIVAILKDMLSSEGFFNQIRMLYLVNIKGLDPSVFKPLLYMDKPELFRAIYTLSGVWQGVGWGSIIYLSAISSIDPQLYEAVDIDGGGRFVKMRHITLPGIAPTIVILLIFAVGGMMSSSSEKILLMYKPITYDTADVIATFTYRKGLEDFDFSYSTAVGLFSNVINFILLIITNMVARKISDTSLW